MYFKEAIIAVSMMLFYILVGFIFIKTKLIEIDATVPFSKVLLYFCQGALVLFSFSQQKYTEQLGLELLTAFGIALGVQLFILGAMFLLFRRKYDNVGYRLLTVGSNCGNVAFFGIPLLQSVLPGNTAALAYTTMFSLTLNLICYTLGSYIISGDKKYISLKKVFINPITISLVVALPIFFTNTEYPETIQGMIEITGKMSSVLAMFILGMRFATFSIKDFFKGREQYLALLIKCVIMPLIVMLVIYFTDLNVEFKKAIFVIATVPSASIILPFSELVNQGQKNAAKIILFTTIFSIVTIPIMLLLLQYFT